MLRKLRPYVEQFPRAAALYRAIRDELRSNVSPVDTPFGFKLAGRDDMANGSFEPEESAYLMDHLSEFDVFVDVGANIGFYSCLARKLGKFVVAIEPLPDNLKFLYNNLLINGWSDTEVFPLGLASQPGLVPIFGGGTGASLVSGWADSTTAYRSQIPVSTLDHLLGNRFGGSRLFVKIDVEGAEYDLLRGASATLARRPWPTFLVEVCLTEHHPTSMHPNFRDVFELFWRSGYEASTIRPERSIGIDDVSRWIRDRRQDFGSHNFIFRSTAR